MIGAFTGVRRWVFSLAVFFGACTGDILPARVPFDAGVSRDDAAADGGIEDVPALRDAAVSDAAGADRPPPDTGSPDTGAAADAEPEDAQPEDARIEDAAAADAASDAAPRDAAAPDAAPSLDSGLDLDAGAVEDDGGPGRPDR